MCGAQDTRRYLKLGDFTATSLPQVISTLHTGGIILWILWAKLRE